MIDHDTPSLAKVTVRPCPDCKSAAAMPQSARVPTEAPLEKSTATYWLKCRACGFEIFSRPSLLEAIQAWNAESAGADAGELRMKGLGVGPQGDGP